jgi:quercetin dioxygenase-like cupin family protein
MALQHAQPLDVIDVGPLGPALRSAVSASLLKTPTLQLMRVVLPAGRELPEHHVAGAITVQCLEGEVVVTAPARRVSLRQGQLVMLSGGETHAVRSTIDSSLLVTVLLNAR